MNEEFKWDFKIEEWQAAMVSSGEMMKAFDLAVKAAYRPGFAITPFNAPPPQPTNAQMADVLEKAADILESETLNWIQGRLYSTASGEIVGVCAVGSVRQTNNLSNRSSDGWRRTLVTDKVETYLADLLGMELYQWNDTPGRTRIEVIELFKTVAKDLRNEDG